MKNVLIIIVLLGSFGGINAQSAHKYLRQGDKDYKSQNYTKAEEDYRKALEKNKSAQGSYNLGNTIYQQERYDEAASKYEDAAQAATEESVKAKAYHNLGNAYFNKQEYDKSIEAYKNSLRLNPSDMETKINLALAQHILQQQQQEQNQDQQQEQQPEEPQTPPDSPQPQQPQEGEGESEQEQQRDLTKEEARKLLEIIEQEEQKVQQKLRKAQAKPTKSKKDW